VTERHDSSGVLFTVTLEHFSDSFDDAVVHQGSEDCRASFVLEADQDSVGFVFTKHTVTEEGERRESVRKRSGKNQPLMLLLSPPSSFVAYVFT